MVVPGLIIISLMWFTVALLNLGYGEVKSTGFICTTVGILTIACGFADGVMGGPLGGGLLFAHGLLYISIGHALLTGIENIKSVGNISLVVAFISTIYATVHFINGDSYLSFMAVGYAVLTYMVWANFYGKLSNKVVAWSLIIWIPIGLWIPAFLLGLGKVLPF